MTKFDELKQRYPNLIPVQELRSNVSIVELAIEYGYQPQRHKGQSRPVLEHPAYKDTIIIKNPKDASQQVYQRAGDFTDSGTVIDFIRNRLSTVFSTFNRPGEHEFKNISSVLYDYLRIDPNHVSQNRKITAALSQDAGPKQPFTKEQFDLRALENTNYLTSRHIAPETLNRPEFINKVVAQVAYFNPKTGHTEDFQTAKEHPERNYLQFNNVAFPYYNGQTNEITGLELRNEKIKLHAPGSDRYSSVFVSNPPSSTERFYVMESAIDVLSQQQLRRISGDDKFNAVYFSTGGQLTQQQVSTIARYINTFPKAENYTINLAFDNDASGHRFDLQFIQQLAATKFPMSSTVGSSNRISYLLPEEEAYRPVREGLLARAESFNQNVRAQIVLSDSDPLGKKELIEQQITIGSNGKKFALNIPESGSALSAMSKALLELTGLNVRIVITKACGKDFNEDLVREVNRNEKYRYSLTDDSGKTITYANTATTMARTVNHLRNSVESDGMSNTFTVYERQSFGFRQERAKVKIINGQTVSATQSPEFDRQIQTEKKERILSPKESVAGHAQEKIALNPENKPSLGQSPQPRSGDDEPKRKIR